MLPEFLTETSDFLDCLFFEGVDFGDVEVGSIEMRLPSLGEDRPFGF
jgi:hypothetical protein